MLVTKKPVRIAGHAGRRLLSAFLAGMVVLYGQAVFAETATANAGTGTDASAALDLSSTSRGISARVPGKYDSIDIQVGDVTRTVKHGDLLTPAEFVALKQVISGKQQSLILDGAGSAIAGQFFLSNRIAKNFNDVIIPGGVTALLNAAKSRELDVAGKLVNGGNIFAFSSNATVNRAAISAATITNNQNAVISSILPPLGLTGVNSAVEGLNLILNARQGDFTNYGTVSSSSNLTVTAAGAIVNALPTGASGPSPVMSAMGSLNLVSGAGSIINTTGALLAASAGNINISTLVPHDILINSLGGQLQTLMGAINVRDRKFDGSHDIDITGGDWLAREINLYSGTGAIRAHLNKVVGTLNTFGGFANVGTSTGDLSLGEICISGDPTYYNPGGSINITGDISVAERLTILARDDITSSGTNRIITARDGSDQGFDITMVAGFELSPLVGVVSTGTIAATPPVADNTDANVTVTGTVSASGGNIDFSSLSFLFIDASSTSGNLDGGSLTMLAANPAGGSRGRILLPGNSLIQVSGSGTGANGNVTFIAGGDGSPSPVITLGSIVADQSTGAGGGNIDIRTAAPAVSPGGVTFDTTGAIVSGSFGSTGITSSADASIRIGDSGGSKSLGARNNLTVIAGTHASSIITSNGGNLTFSAGNNLTVSAGGRLTTAQAAAGSAGNLTLGAGTVTSTGSISAPEIQASGQGLAGDGGNVSAIAGSSGNITLGAITASGSAGGTGNGGDIFLNSGTLATMTAGNIQASGGLNDGSGGSVLLVSGTSGVVNTGSISAAGSGNGGGGTVTINSGAFGDTTTGMIVVDGGTTGGDGGIVDIIAGASSTVSIGDIDAKANSTTGNAGEVAITAGESAQISTGSIEARVDAPGSSGNGGTVEIEAGDLASIFIDDFILAQSGATGGFGGIVSLTAGDSAHIEVPQSIVASGFNSGGSVTLTSAIGGTIITGFIEATGGSPSGSSDGGTVTITAGESASISTDYIDASSAGMGGNGGTVTVTAGDSTDITTADILAAGTAPAGDGGDVTITAGASSDVSTGNIDVHGDDRGGSVSISSGTAGMLNTGDIDANAGAPGSGDGGSVTVTVDKTIPFTVGTGGNILSISANAGTTGGDGGDILVRNAGNGGVSLFSFDVSVDAPMGSGGAIEFDAAFGPLDGPLVFNTTGGTLSVNGGDGNGGDITLRASTTNLSALTNPLILTATGSSGFSGGNIFILTTGSGSGADITLGSSAGQADLNTTGGPAGGSITVLSGHDVTVADDLSTDMLVLSAAHTLTVNAGVTVTGLNSVDLTTPELSLGADSLITTVEPSSTVSITSPAGSDLTIESPSGFSATIESAPGVFSYSVGNQPIAGSINITPAAGQALVFSNSGVNPATLNLEGGPLVTTTTGASTTVDDGVTIASDSLIVTNVNNGTLFNSGHITSSASGTSPQFNSSTSLVAKFGSTVTIESLGGSLTLDGNGAGQISATGTGGAPFFFNACSCFVNIGPNITVLAYGPDSVNVDASYTFNTGTSAFTTIGKVNTDVSGAVNTSGAINIGDNVTITQVGGTLPGLPSNFFGAINFSTPEIRFGAGSSVVSLNNANSDIKIGSNHFDTTQAPLTVILPDSSSVSLATLSNPLTGGGLALIGPGVRTASGGNQLGNTLLSFLKSAGTGTTSLDVTGGRLQTATMNNTIIDDSVQLSSAAAVMVLTTEVSLGAGSSLSSSLASGTAVAVLGNFAPGLTLTLPDSASVTMSTGGGSIFLGPGAPPATSTPPGTAPTPVSNLPLLFAKTVGTGTAILNLSGGQVVTQTTNQTTTISTGVTLTSDSPIVMNVNNSTLTNNGEVNYTGSSTATTITVQSTGNLGLAGTGTFGNQTTGTTAFLAMAAGSVLTLADGTALTVSGGGDVSIRSPNLTFAATATGPSLTATGASAINVDAGNSSTNVNLLITAPAGFAATLATAGGTVSLAATGAGTLTFANSGLTQATVNLNGGPVTLAGSSVTVNEDVTVASDSAITINVEDSSSGSLSLESNATVTATGGDLSVQANGSLLVNMDSDSMLQAGSATALEGFDLRFNPLAAADITIDGGAGPLFNGRLSAEGDLVTFNGGAVDVRVNEVSGTIEADADSLSAESNLALTVGAITANGAISIRTDEGLTTTAGIAGDSVTLESGAGFDVEIGANVIATNDINVTAGGSGNINQTAGTLAGATVDLSSLTGNIGSTSANIMTEAANILANTGGSGDVLIMEADSVGIGASSAGDQFVLSAGGDIATSGAIVAPQVTLQTTAGSNGGISLGDDVGQAGGTTTLIADGSGAITRSAGSVLGDTASLASETGSIGASLAPIETAVANLSLNTGGSGSVFVHQTGPVTLSDATAGGDFRLTSTDATSVNSIVTLDGLITVANDTGMLQVLPGALLSTGSGDITLQNNDTALGTILIGTSTRMIAGGDLLSPGSVFVVIGPVPLVPVKGKAPANVVASTAFKGQIFFGTNSIFAQPPTNTVFASSGRVVFNTGTLPGTAITLNGDVRIGAVGGPLFGSLDLTDPGVTSAIVAQQQAKALGGKLKLDASGIAIGGSLTLTPFNLSPTLSAVNIPTKVKVTMNNFVDEQDFVVQLTLGSSTPFVVINGAVTFKSTGASPVLSIGSDVGGTVLSVGSTGSIASKSGLTVNAGGDVFLGGKVSVGNLMIETTTSSNGDIIVATSIGLKSLPTTLIADGSGSIVQTGGSHSIAGGTVELFSGSGSIGSTGGVIRTSAANLLVSTGGSGTVSVDNKGSLTLLAGSGSGGDFHVGASGALNVGDVSTLGGSIDLVATGKLPLTILSGSTISALEGNIVIQHTSGATVSILIGANATIIANASAPPLGNVTVFVGVAPPPQVNQTAPPNVVEIESLGGTIFYGTNSILANAPVNTITAKGANVVFSTGTRPASAITLGGGVSITADPPVPLAASSILHSHELAPASGFWEETSKSGHGPGVTPPAPASQAPLNGTSTVNGQVPTATRSPETSGSGNTLLPIAYIPGFPGSYFNQAAVSGNAAPPRRWQSGRAEAAGLAHAANAAATSNETWFFDGAGVHSSTAQASRHWQRRSLGGSPGHVAVQTGDVIFAPAREAWVSTPAGKLQVAPGSVVLALCSPEATVFYSLHDSRRAAVRFSCDDEEIVLAPGRALILTNGRGSGLPDRHPARSVGYRNVKSFYLRNGYSACSAEFSIPSALQTLKTLQRLQKSSISRHRKTLTQVIKTAAVLRTMKVCADQYKPLGPLAFVSSR
jgi:hypothetical protein